MSAITVQKELLAKRLVANGIQRQRIARSTEQKQALQQASLFPWAAIISNTARFELPDRREVVLPSKAANSYKQLRCKIVQPFVLQVFHEDEESCTALIESIIENIDYDWQYKGLQGQIELKSCEHSDFYAAVIGCYESALLLEFEMDLGRDAVQGKRIGGIGQEGNVQA